MNNVEVSNMSDLRKLSELNTLLGNLRFLLGQFDKQYGIFDKKYGELIGIVSADVSMARSCKESISEITSSIIKINSNVDAVNKKLKKYELVLKQPESTKFKKMIENQSKYIDKIGCLTDLLGKSESIIIKLSSDIDRALAIAKKNNKSEIDKNEVIEIIKKIADFIYENRETIKKVAQAVGVVVALFV